LAKRRLGQREKEKARYEYQKSGVAGRLYIEAKYALKYASVEMLVV